MISVSENPVIQSHPVRWHRWYSTNWTGLTRFSHWLRYGSPAQFPLPVLFPVPFRIFHIPREANSLLLPLFLRFLCFPRKKETYYPGKKIKHKRPSPREKDYVPEDRHERSIGGGVWSWIFPWNCRAIARNRAVLEKTMAVAIATVPLEQPNMEDIFLKFLEPASLKILRNREESFQENQRKREIRLSWWRWLVVGTWERRVYVWRDFVRLVT